MLLLGWPLFLLKAERKLQTASGILSVKWLGRLDLFNLVLFLYMRPNELCCGGENLRNTRLSQNSTKRFGECPLCSFKPINPPKIQSPAHTDFTASHSHKVCMTSSARQPQRWHAGSESIFSFEQVCFCWQTISTCLPQEMLNFAWKTQLLLMQY